MTTAFVSTPVLTVSGTAKPDVAANLIAMTVEETIVGMYSCEIRLGNFGFDNGAPGYVYLHRDVLDFGTPIAVTVGPPAGSRQIFAGKISALQADYPAGEQAQLLIFAEDGLQDLRLTRRTRTFEDMSTEDIATQIASEHGLTAATYLDGPTRKVSAQLNQSDLAFLRSLARRDDAELWLDGTSINLLRRPDRAGTAINLTYGAELLSFSVRADLADQCSTLGVTGWDVSAKDAISETADSSALGSELATGDTAGASVLATAFAPRTEYLVRTAPWPVTKRARWRRRHTWSARDGSSAAPVSPAAPRPSRSEPP